MTRGTPRRLDYRFVGDGPPRRWWSALDDLVVLEGPGVIVRGHPDGSGVLVSGIPSARRDIIGTPIRFTLVAEDPGPALLARLVAAGLVVADRAALGAELDGACPTERVDAAFAGDEAAVAELTAALDRVFVGSVASGDGSDGDGSGPAWVGSAQDGGAVAEFRRRAAELGNGATGWAFTTAALSSVDGVRAAVASLGEPAVVLLDEGGPVAIVDLRSPVRVHQGKAPAGRSAGRTRSFPPRPVLIGVSALAVVVLAMIILLAAL